MRRSALEPVNEAVSAYLTEDEDDVTVFERGTPEFLLFYGKMMEMFKNGGPYRKK
jgi:hypothetical protein